MIVRHEPPTNIDDNKVPMNMAPNVGPIARVSEGSDIGYFEGNKPTQLVDECGIRSRGLSTRDASLLTKSRSQSAG